MPDIKKVIVSAYPGYEELHALSKPTIEIFAKNHGYDLRFHDNNPTDLPASWAKIPHLLTAFDAGYDAALWLDADLVIVDPSEDVPISPLSHQALARHAAQDGTIAVNCGVWYLRKEAVPFLQEVWKTGPVPAANPLWWEQNTVMQVLGIPPFPPYALPDESNAYLEKLFELPYEWNISPHTKTGFNTYGRKFRILHAAGCGSVARRADIMRRWIQQLGPDVAA